MNGSGSTHVDFLADLQQRGLLHQVSSPGLADALRAPGMTGYCGFDPTADSLHVGSLLPVTLLRRFQLAGHRPIAVVGGATGLIGDPSGKESERSMLSPEQVERNVAGIRRQIESMLDCSGSDGGASAGGGGSGRVVSGFGGGGAGRSASGGGASASYHPALIVNNADWLRPVGLLDFLRDIGKHFSVNQMIVRDSVRTRLEQRDQGISYTEFSYMLLQSYDYLALFDQFGCRVQMGGSDQYGNILSGCDLIRRLRGQEAFGVVVPLLTRSDGKKFGKSEEGNVWLDPARTSPYQFYQFWLNADDRDAAGYLKSFTFLSLEQIADFERLTASAPQQRAAQKALAAELTRMVHGEAALQRAAHATEVLFGSGGDFRSLSAQQLEEAFRGAPSSALPRGALGGEAARLVNVLADCGLYPSRGQARKDMPQGSVSVNNVPVKDGEYTLSAADVLDGGFIILRKGKKHYHVVRVG